MNKMPMMKKGVLGILGNENWTFDCMKEPPDLEEGMTANTRLRQR
jgi:hypothetical protein